MSIQKPLNCKKNNPPYGVVHSCVYKNRLHGVNLDSFLTVFECE